MQPLQGRREPRRLLRLRAHLLLDRRERGRSASASARFDDWISSSSACSRVKLVVVFPCATSCASSAPSQAIESIVAASFVSACRSTVPPLQPGHDTSIDDDSEDPLPIIWRGTLWFWNDYTSSWLDGTVSIPHA